MSVSLLTEVKIMALLFWKNCQPEEISPSHALQIRSRRPRDQGVSWMSPPNPVVVAGGPAQGLRPSSISVRVSARAAVFGLWLGPQGCRRQERVQFGNHLSEEKMRQHMVNGVKFL